MKPKIIAAFILVGLVLVAGWLLVSSKDFQEEKTGAFLITEEPLESEIAEPPASQTAPSEASPPFGSGQAGQASFIVDFGDDNVKSFELSVVEGGTAFDLLQESGLQFEFKEYELGVFIEAIDGVKNGADNKYWLYYVNGEMPMVAADKQPVSPGDRVEFKFEKSTF